MRAILEVQHKAIFIQSESSEYFHAEGPDCLNQANVLNERRFLSLDLTYGHPLNVKMYRVPARQWTDTCRIRVVR